MKKKAALGTTALAVLASTIPAQVAPVHAEELMMEVHTKYNSGGSNTAHTGNGTEGSPFNLFEDAIAKVAPGGTIIIHDEAFLNEVTQNNLPFLINKNITIKSVTGKHATLEVRTPGIILGDDVKFENINLEFTNKHHDAIFVNGHTLDLINVTRSTGTREIDLFAGTLYTQLNGQPVHTPGDKSVINVESNGQFLGESLESKFGNIYAGSMNGDFNADAEINVSRKDSSKKLVIGAIYGSGALEADPGHMLDTREPLAPEAKPEEFKMYGNVNVTLNNYQVSVDGNTGTDSSTTSVSTNSVYKSDLALKNVQSLEVTSGSVNLVSFPNESLSHIPNIKLANDTILGFGTNGGVNRNFSVDSYEGNGTVVLRTDAKLTIANQVTQGSSLNLAIKDYFGGKSDPAIEDTIHLDTPKGTNVTFNPHSTQSYLTVHPVEKDGRLEWTVMDKKKVPTTPVQPEPEEEVKPTEPQPEPEEVVTPTINAFTIEAANKNIVKSVDDFEGTSPTIQYPFSVDAEEGFSLIGHKDLELTVGEHKAKPTDKGYYVEEHKMLITLEPTDDAYTMSVKFDEAPAEGAYNIKLAVGDVSLETSLTVNGKEGNKVTAFKDYDDIKTVPFAYAGTVKLPFTIETSLDGELEFPNAETTLLVNNQPAQFNPETKTFTLDGMTFAVNHKEDKSYELVVTSETVKAGMYDILLTQGEAVMNTALTIQAKPENEFKVLYLDEIKSPFGYRPHMSYCYHYQGVLVNQNHAGKFISLKVKGDVREYPKGYTVQGNAALAFDTRYQDKYFTRLVGKVGIDSSQANVGNGATIKLYTSTNGTQWTLLKTLGTVKGENDAIEFDISMPNGAILKFDVSNNGDAAGDIVSFADLKLVGDDYVEIEKVINVKGLKRVEEYDAILRENTPEYNLANHKMEILQREFVNKMGYVNIKTIYDESPEYAEAIEYLLNDEVALEYLITGGPATKDGSYNRAIRYFCDIYAAHKADFADKSDNHFYLRLALSTALVYAHPSLATSWYGRSYNTGPVTRYELYKEIVAGGYMDRGGATDGFGKWSTQQFKDLPIPLMRWVVGNRMNNDEVKWLADYALSQKEANRKYLDAYNYIEYLDGNFGNPRMYDPANKDMFNAEYGNFSNYFDNYGADGLVRLWMVFEEGAVCGGLSKTYLNLATTFGRPSSVLGQPGHGAAMTWGWNSTLKRYEWQIQNDIYGWANSGNELGDRLLNWGNKPWTVPYAASYNILATDAVLDKDNKFNTATILNYLANSYGEKDREIVFEQALATQPINLESMEGLINAYKADSNKTSQDYLDLAKRIVSTYTYYPQVMVEMLALIQGNITDPNHTVQVDILKNNALVKASVATADVSTNPHATKQLAEKYLKGEDFGEVATFSFDGVNAGKIVMNERYRQSQIMLKYSLDGGNTWKQTSEQVISLSEKELKSITAENDIKISLVGVDTVHTIDILTGPATTGNKVIANDFENLLIGNLTNLEFSYDGEEWCDYVTGQEQTINPNGLTGIRFNGEKQVHVRYKANGTTLAGESQVFNFTPNEDTPEKSYVQLREVKVISAPQHQKGREPQNAINGSIVDNGYHTTFGTTTKDKVITFEFSTPKYITSMDYMFGGGNNGRMMNGTIQASMDGKEWKVIKTFKDIPRDKPLQEYKMDEVVEAKFIKIVADETHGNSGQHNMFLAVLDLRFYEDITKLSAPPTTEPTPPATEPEVEPVPPTPVYPQEPPMEGPGAGDLTPPVQEDSSEGTPPSDNVGTTDKPVDTPPSDSAGTGTDNKTEDTPVNKPTTGDTPANKPVENKPSPDTDKPVESKPSTEGSTNKPSTDTNKPVENKPSTDTDKPVENKPSTEGTSGTPNTEGTNKPVENKPSNNVGTTGTSNTPSVGTGTSSQPPKQDSFTVTLEKEEVKPTPPTNKEEEVKPTTPTHTNKVEKLEELAKDLVEKVDSIIADVTKKANDLIISVVGDKEDIKHVSSLEVTKEGVFADIEGEKVKFDMELDLNNLDLDKYRVVRKNKSGEGFSAVPHKYTGDGFKISSSNLEGIVVTEKVNIPFKDVTNNDWFKSDVEEMYNYGFTTGTTAETFSPYDNITRGQFAAMIARALELTPTSKKNNLADTKGKWYADDAQALFDAGIIKGFNDGTFGGEQKLTRQQAATMMVNMLKYAGVDTKVSDKVDFKDIDKVSVGAQDAVKFLASKGVLVSGEDTNFNPSNNITRSQMSKLLIRSLHLTDLY